MKAYNYRVLLTPEPESGFTITVPMLPNCMTYGETVNECTVNAKEAVDFNN